jgi:hypothetical protein
MVLIILNSLMFHLRRKGERRAGEISVHRIPHILIGTDLLAYRRDRWLHSCGIVLEFGLLDRRADGGVAGHAGESGRPQWELSTRAGLESMRGIVSFLGGQFCITTTHPLGIAFPYVLLPPSRF